MRRVELVRDQAAGLRRLFASAATTYVPVAATRGATGSLVANLASACVRIGHSVLVVDQTPGEVATALGLAARRELAHVIEGERDFAQVVLTADAGLSVLSARRGLALLAEREHTLSQALSRIEGRFDLVLVHADPARLPAALGPCMPDVVLPIVVAPDALSAAYVEVKRSARRGSGIRALMHGVATPMEARALFASLSGVAERFLDARPDYAGFVPSDPALHRAVAARRTVFEIDPASPAARALEFVAATLGERRPTLA